MAPKKCCVGGCNATSVTHRLFLLPKDDNLRNLWMFFLVPLSPLLIGLTKKQLLSKKVCHQHFDKYQLDGHGRRTLYSYPCLFSAAEIAHGIPLSSEEYHVVAEHNYHQQQGETNIDDMTEAGTSLISEGGCFNEHSYASISSTVPSCIGETHNMNIPATLHKQKDEPSQPSCSSAAMATSSYCETDRILHSSESTHTPKAAAMKKRLRSKKRTFVLETKKISCESLGKPPNERLEDAQKINEQLEFFENYNALGKHAKTFLNLQLKLSRKNKMGRRFDMHEKLLALTLCKQSPKGYKLLQKMFALPSKRTLNRLSEKICFEEGLNKKVFHYVEQNIKTWPQEKKLCTIVFDEIALSPHLTYNPAKDKIEGLVTLKGQKICYCDHALVFMVRGICDPWRQSIAYFFIEGTISALQLVNILKEIVEEVAKTGLIPLGLVCDQGSTFRSAMRILRQETIRARDAQGIRDYGTIEISGQDLNIIYDPPHLLKSIRNNFVTKDIIFEGKVGSWDDILFIYEIDSQLGHTRALPKLNAYNVVPNKIKKMKVSAATQVLSARTAAMLKYTNALYLHQNKEGQSTNTMSTTADVIVFFDKLFDSVNGSPGSSKRGKLRSSVKVDSPHVEFWQGALRKLKNIKYKDTKSKMAMRAGHSRIVSVPCLHGWITTIESFIRLSKLLHTKYKVHYYYPRCVNQDPLENFFGKIRALNYRNVNPDAHAFISSFKSLILSDILSPHSRFSNCENDEGENIINLKYLFDDDENSNKENIDPDPSVIQVVPSSSSSETENFITQVLMEKIRVQCSAYTAGYICRKITKFLNCNMCVKTYTSQVVPGIHDYIRHREFKSLKRDNLKYPNEYFLRLYRDASQCVHSYLNNYCQEENIRKTLTSILTKQLNLNLLGCVKHKIEIKKKFLDMIIKLQVHNWCKIINKIFKGSIEKKYAMKMEEPQKMAYKKYEKNKSKKRAIDKIKNFDP